MPMFNDTEYWTEDNQQACLANVTKGCRIRTPIQLRSKVFHVAACWFDQYSQIKGACHCEGPELSTYELTNLTPKRCICFGRPNTEILEDIISVLESPTGNLLRTHRKQVSQPKLSKDLTKPWINHTGRRTHECSKKTFFAVGSGG